MKQIKSVFILCLLCLVGMNAWAANSVITYTATEKLPETNSEQPNDAGIRPNAFSGASGTLSFEHTFDNGIGTITFNGELTGIGTYAFCNCKAMSSITIPASVTEIGDENAFFNCSNLTTVTFANNSQLKTIGTRAFNWCIKLPSIVIPNTVTTIGESAF